MSDCFGKILTFKYKHLNTRLEIWDSYRSLSFKTFAFLKYSVVWLLKGKLWMALQAFFSKMNILLVMLAYVPWQTSIPYRKNGLMSEQYNVFIISNGKYLYNLNDIYANIFRYFSSYHVYMIFECEMFIKNYSQVLIITVLYWCHSNFNIC